MAAFLLAGPVAEVKDLMPVFALFVVLVHLLGIIFIEIEMQFSQHVASH